MTSDFSVKRYVPRSLVEHRSRFQPETIRIGNHPVWLIKNPAGQMANAVLIEGRNGLVVFDAGASRYHGEAILSEIRKISDLPIEAVVYSHHHGDHTTGTGALVLEDDVRAERVQVIARDNFMEEYLDEDFMTGPIQSLRSVYQFGGALEAEDLKDYVIGCGGGVLPSGPGAFVEPNTFVAERQTLALAGIEFEFIPTGGESASHMVAWLPEMRIVLGGDEVYPALPNLHSPRGTKFRDARDWIRAIDIIRGLEPDYLVPSHGPPVSGRQELIEVLTVYRDALQYVHDQAIRFTNKGFTQQELAERLCELPPQLRLTPWTDELYGKLRHIVPNVFCGYIGWFSGDAVDLSPTPRAEMARRLIRLMGGTDRVHKEAVAALGADDPQFAAELATLLLRVEPGDAPARRLKAAAFRTMGYRHANSIWRSWYLTGARELEDRFDIASAWRDLMENVRGPGNLAGLPTLRVLELLRYRIAADDAGAAHIGLCWEVTDRDEFVYAELRRGILEVSPEPLPRPRDAMIRMVRRDLDALATGSLALRDAIVAGTVAVVGEPSAALEFSSYLEPFDYDLSLSAR